MERRYVVFIVVVILILGTHVGLRVLFAPPAPPEVVVKPEDQEKNKTDKDKSKAKDEKKSKDDTKTAGAKPPDKPETPAGEKPVGEKPAIEPASASRHHRVALGSVDANSGYAMLVILDSRGAAVERVELSSERYRDIDDLSGYLGHLGLEDAKDGGGEVTVVGPGTPAALAKETSDKVKGGLVAGDVITALGDTPVANAAAIDSQLSKDTKPGETLRLTVSRRIAEKPTTLIFEALLSRRPLELLRPESHLRSDKQEADPLSFLLTLESVGDKVVAGGQSEIKGLPSLRNRDWKLEKQTANSVEFSYALTEADLKGIGKTGSLRLVKRYSLPKAETNDNHPYHLNLHVEVQNSGQEAQQVAYRLDGPNGLPLEGWWYSNKLHPEMWAAAGARDVTWRVADGPHRLLGCPKIYSDAKAAADDKKTTEQTLLANDEGQPLEYVGVDTQFFAAVMQPQAGKNGPQLFRRAFAQPVQDVTAVDKKHIKMMNVSFVLVSPSTSLEPGKSLATDFQVFMGPKEQSLLERPEYKLVSLIERGWSYASYPAIVLMKVLHGIHYLTQNYGVAIILLTVLVRTCMIPMSLRQAKSAAKMQELAPEMTKLKEKYKDDMEKQSAALKELYAKHNFNPFGGCLLVFIQLPIFIGLYRCLSVDIELRDADLISGLHWASNLAGPDKLFAWKEWLTFMGLGDETGWLGPFCNVLPVITCLLFIVQQKLFTPPATDEQSAMQQKMMMYMTVFMGVMFFKVPAGLCIYFITSSLWSIIERKLITKPKLATAGAAGNGNSSYVVKSNSNGSSGENAERKKLKKK